MTDEYVDDKRRTTSQKVKTPQRATPGHSAHSLSLRGTVQLRPTYRSTSSVQGAGSTVQKAKPNADNQISHNINQTLSECR